MYSHTPVLLEIKLGVFLSRKATRWPESDTSRLAPASREPATFLPDYLHGEFPRWGRRQRRAIELERSSRARIQLGDLITLPTPPESLREPTMENLYKVLDFHCDQIAEVRTLIDAAATNSPDFKQTIQFLLVSTVLYVRCMSDWFDENLWPMQFCAWAARNLFELEIWTRFVLKKREYAERFGNDWIMDGIGILEGMEAWAKIRGDSGSRALLERLRAKRDSELPGCKRFLDARDYIEELGMAEEYKCLNPVFSKLVHSTSWSVLWRQELLDRSAMRGFIVTLGTTFSARIITAVRKHVEQHGVEPV